MDRHERVVLQFSAGKDSAACLKLLHPWLEKVIVLWCDGGDSYKETLEYMAVIAANVPNFVTARGMQKEFVKSAGYPADLAPFLDSPIGRMASSGQGIKISSLVDCCNYNLWQPLRQATVRTGATGVIRGDRREEALRSVVECGSVHEGQEYWLPLLDWSEEQVLQYLGDSLPPSYKRGLRSSLDCRTCTAYLDHNPGRIKDLAVTEPDAYAEIKPVILHLQKRAKAFAALLEEQL